MSLSSRIILQCMAFMGAALPATKGNQGDLNNGTNGTGFADGTGSGEADRVLLASSSLGAAATDSYDLLAAGSLTDIQGNAIDADELKGFAVKCLTGGIKVVGGVGTPLPIFTGSTEGLMLGPDQMVAFDLGAVGNDVTTNSKFDITDLGAGSTTYEIWALVAQ